MEKEKYENEHRSERTVINESREQTEQNGGLLKIENDEIIITQ
jgi:hypothetical protein